MVEPGLTTVPLGGSLLLLTDHAPPVLVTLFRTPIAITGSGKSSCTEGMMNVRLRSTPGAGIPSSVKAGASQFQDLSRSGGMVSSGSVRTQVLLTGICSAGPTSRTTPRTTSMSPLIAGPDPG